MIITKIKRLFVGLRSRFTDRRGKREPWAVRELLGCGCSLSSSSQGSEGSGTQPPVLAHQAGSEGALGVPSPRLLSSIT